MKADALIKSIVNTVKSKEELKGVACIYSGKREISQNPVSGFTLCLGVGKVKYDSTPESYEPIYSTELKLCLLAPSGAGGKRLSEMALWIAEAVRESFTVSSMEVCEPVYNDVSSVLYSDITVTVEDTSLAHDVCKLFVDGEFTLGLVSFEVESAKLSEKRGQLLNGYSFEKTGAEDFALSIKTESLLKLPDNDFELKLDYENHGEIYRGCAVIKVKRELSYSGKLSFGYEIAAKSCELFEKEVQSE